jgi:hypothetical protein
MFNAVGRDGTLSIMGARHGERGFGKRANQRRNGNACSSAESALIERATTEDDVSASKKLHHVHAAVHKVVRDGGSSAIVVTDRSTDDRVGYPHSHHSHRNSRESEPSPTSDGGGEREYFRGSDGDDSGVTSRWARCSS